MLLHHRSLEFHSKNIETVTGISSLFKSKIISKSHLEIKWEIFIVDKRINLDRYTVISLWTWKHKSFFATLSTTNGNQLSLWLQENKTAARFPLFCPLIDSKIMQLLCSDILHKSLLFRVHIYLFLLWFPFLFVMFRHPWPKWNEGTSLVAHSLFAM